VAEVKGSVGVHGVAEFMRPNPPLRLTAGISGLLNASQQMASLGRSNVFRQTPPRLNLGRQHRQIRVFQPYSDAGLAAICVISAHSSLIRKLRRRKVGTTLVIFGMFLSVICE
jgi:hypothetical protein